MSEKFTLNDFLDIKDKLEVAREDDTPFAVHNDGTLSVVGDPNKTEQKKFDYTVKFRYEKDELEVIPNNAKEFGKYVVFSVDFDDIFINPRKDMELMECILNIYPILNSFFEIADAKQKEAKELGKKYNIEVNIDENGQFILSKENKTLKQELETLTRKANIEMIHVYNESGDIGQESIYKFVQLLLNIDDDMADHMLPSSVLGTLYATIANNPEFFNESETVFGF